MEFSETYLKIYERDLFISHHIKCVIYIRFWLKILRGMKWD